MGVGVGVEGEGPHDTWISSIIFSLQKFLWKCFLLVFALVKESKQGQDKIILLLIVIPFPPPHPFFFRISASISSKSGKTKNKY